MMLEKRTNPNGIVFLFPDSDEKNEEWEEKDIWINNNRNYSNVPYIDCSLFDDCYDLDCESLKNALKMNDQEYIAYLVSEIKKRHDISDVGSWTFAAIALDRDYDILLYIAGEYWPAVKRMVETFNEAHRQEGYEPLSANDKTMSVEGQFCPKSEDRGFFEKRRIRKQNKAYEKALLEFLDSLYEYLTSVV